MSTHKIIAPGVVGEDGGIHLSRRGEFDKQVRESFKPGQKVLTTTEAYDDRLAAMWGYYYAVLIPYGIDHFGYETKDEMHAAWKYEFNPEYFTDRTTGVTTRTGGSTQRMSKTKQIAFVESCARHLAQEGVNVPPPIWDRD